jgi:hypothetical protein
MNGDGSLLGNLLHMNLENNLAGVCGRLMQSVTEGTRVAEILADH